MNNPMNPGIIKAGIINPGMTNPTSAISDILRTTRITQHITQAQLSKLSDISINTIKNLENGHQRNPRIFTIIQLCRALKLNITIERSI